MKIKLIFLFVFFLIGGFSLFIYNKLYYPLPNNAELISKKGNLMWYNRPALSESGGNIYVGWMTLDRRVVIGEILRETGELLSKVYLHKWRYLDDHGAPIIHVIKGGGHKGKLISIYNLHNSEIYFQRSINPGDIIRWEAKKIINKCECTYPSLLEINETLYLFYRKQIDKNSKTRAYFMKISTDYGDTWNDEKEVIEVNEGEWAYAMVSGSDIGTIHIAWGVFDPSIKNIKNIFYAKSYDGGESWNSLTNQKKSRKLKSMPEYLVRSSPRDKATRIWDFRVDDIDNPILLSVDYDKEKAFAHWTGYVDDQWLNVDLGENSKHYYPCGLVFKGDNYNRVYMTKDQPNGVSSIDEISINYQSNSWKTEFHVVNDSDYSYCRPLSGRSYSGLLFTAIRTYENFMNFDTWLISMQRKH